MKLDNIKLFVFDLGGTLMEYKGMHLSWTGYYKSAFEYVNAQLDLRNLARILQSQIPAKSSILLNFKRP